MTETEAYVQIKVAERHVSLTGHDRIRDVRDRLWCRPDEAGRRTHFWRMVYEWCQSDPEWQVALMIARLEA